MREADSRWKQECSGWQETDVGFGEADRNKLADRMKYWPAFLDIHLARHPQQNDDGTKGTYLMYPLQNLRTEGRDPNDNVSCSHLFIRRCLRDFKESLSPPTKT
jgi:hypothetical protein